MFFRKKVWKITHASRAIAILNDGLIPRYPFEWPLEYSPAELTIKIQIESPSPMHIGLVNNTLKRKMVRKCTTIWYLNHVKEQGLTEADFAPSTDPNNWTQQQRDDWLKAIMAHIHYQTISSIKWGQIILVYSILSVRNVHSTCPHFVKETQDEEVALPLGAWYNFNGSRDKNMPLQRRMQNEDEYERRNMKVLLQTTKAWPLIVFIFGFLRPIYTNWEMWAFGRQHACANNTIAQLAVLRSIQCFQKLKTLNLTDADSG